ncbi:Cof-type HAD-IIB family hydrolase, partial [Clostridium sp.]|uniref:Cof-type HAD-IIB family hydrolase n=1 Tax=Clostridium sp. TaxID=1506 RepID=UPI002619DF24
MNKRGIVFFDVDGTLIDWTKGITDPSEMTKESIKKLQESGYLTFIATGRPRNLINESLKDLNTDGFICSNGAYVEMNNKVLFNEPLENSKLKKLLKNLEELNIGYMLEGQEKNYIPNREDKFLVDFIEEVNLDINNFSKDWDVDAVKVSKVIAIGENDESYDKAYKACEGENFAFLTNPKAGVFEINDKKFSKGYGVTKVLEKLDISSDKAYAFGDGDNDIEMFQAVKHGIAMGDHYKGLEEFAFDTTENVENEGITKA